MAKLYSKKNRKAAVMLPKKETINFILQYSKTLNVTKIGNLKFASFAN
jgi:hypothetical protein